jgi:hypothetical protein
VGEFPSGTIVLARGARAAERALLDEVWAACAARAPGPGALATPLRVVVPSRSLALHVSSQLVRAPDAPTSALLGLRVQTLFGLAREVLERAGEAHEPSDTLLAVLVRRLARSEPALERALDSLDDGYALVVETARNAA